MTPMEQDLHDLKIASTKLTNLLDQNEVGLASWHIAVAKVVNDIFEIGTRSGMIED